jgi:hypothetical protein
VAYWKDRIEHKVKEGDVEYKRHRRKERRGGGGGQESAW